MKKTRFRLPLHLICRADKSVSNKFTAAVLSLTLHLNLPLFNTSQCSHLQKNLIRKLLLLHLHPLITKFPVMILSLSLSISELQPLPPISLIQTKKSITDHNQYQSSANIWYRCPFTNWYSQSGKTFGASENYIKRFRFYLRTISARKRYHKTFYSCHHFRQLYYAAFTSEIILWKSWSFPFTPVDISMHSYKNMTILPGISTYVGADIVSGIVACGIDQKEEVSLLVDLGTNGEMVIGNKDRLLVTSTAAGPAFEGGQYPLRYCRCSRRNWYRNYFQ